MTSPAPTAARPQGPATPSVPGSSIMVFDLAYGYLFIPLGFMVFGFGTLCIAVLEGWILSRGFRWPTPRLAFRDALVANVLSGLLGGLVFFQWPTGLWLGTYLAMYVITVLLEAVILARRRGLGWVHSLKASVLVNAVSYVALLLVLQGLGMGLW